MSPEEQYCQKHGHEMDWLSQCMDSGFVIHETDRGDLVMIWYEDVPDLEANSRPRITKGQQCYEMRLRGVKWGAMGFANAMLLAKSYAKTRGFQWPVR